GHEPLAALLLSKGASPNCKDPIGMTPLCWSAWTGRTDLTKLLLSHGAHINTPDDQFRMTPLIWAANMEHPSTCDLLVSAGADVFPSDHRGETILHWAAKRGFRGLVWQLIEEAGMSVDIHENYGNTPLHCAVFFGQEDTVRLLLRAGANPNARNRVGMTALHWAAGHRDGFAGIISCLLEHSADPEIPDGSGRKAIYRARMYENVSSISLLQE
ncbi:ankyrin, partial [Tuber magnatum]